MNIPFQKRVTLTLTEKHSESGKVAKISRNETRVKMKAQMPGPPGSIVIKIETKIIILKTISIIRDVIFAQNCYFQEKLYIKISKLSIRERK